VTSTSGSFGARSLIRNGTNPPPKFVQEFSNGGDSGVNRSSTPSTPVVPAYSHIQKNRSSDRRCPA
jgi:hypothetical protein